MYGYSSSSKLWNKYDALIQKNRKVAKSARAWPDVVVKGTQDAYWKMTGDIVRGEFDARDLLLISVRDLKELDRDGTFTAYVLQPEWSAASFDALLGEVRACFDGMPSSEKWTRLIEIVDACREEDLERLLVNIESRLDAWLVLPELPTWEPPEKSHPFMWFVHEDWSLGVFEGALLTAPPHWIFEMCRGVYSPKHRLVRSLALEQMNINWGVMKKIMANPHLNNLTSFNIGGNPVVGTKAFYNKFRTWPGMKKVEHLRLYAITPSFSDWVKGLDGKDHSFASLESVEVMVENV